jgi:hypothetical protein
MNLAGNAAQDARRASRGTHANRSLHGVVVPEDVQSAYVVVSSPFKHLRAGLALEASR